MEASAQAPRPAGNPVRSRLWLAALALGVLLSASYLFVPDVRVPAWALLGYTASAFTVTGVRIHRPRAAVGWYLIAAGQAAFATGETLYYVANGLDRAGAEPGAVVVVCYVAEYACHIAGLSVLVHSRSGDRDTGGLLDALIIATGAAVLVWTFGVAPWLSQFTLAPFAVILGIAFPIGDLAGLTLVIRLVTYGAPYGPAFWLLGLAQLGVLSSDLVFSVLVLDGRWTTGSVADLGWAAYVVLAACAALHPSMRRLTEPARPRVPRVSPPRLVILTAASLVAPIVMLVQWVRGVHSGEPVLALGAAVMFLLTIARIASLMRRESSLYRGKQLFEMMLHSTESERLRIASDLHDGPVQALTTLTYTTHRLRRQVTRPLARRAGSAEGSAERRPGDADPRREREQRREQVGRLLDELEQGLQDQTRVLRRLMTDLRPPALEAEGLEEPLRERLNNLKAASKLLTSMDVRLGGRLPPQVETVIYRVAQECLTNVGKHAQAREVTVALVRHDDEVELVVSDDGVGFDPDDTARLRREGHLGLVSMKERVALAGGRLTVTSARGYGTRVRAVVPLGLDDESLGDEPSSSGRP